VQAVVPQASVKSVTSAVTAAAPTVLATLPASAASETTSLAYGPAGQNVRQTMVWKFVCFACARLLSHLSLFLSLAGQLLRCHWHHALRWYWRLLPHPAVCQEPI
jgi:hypothetical protein